MAYATSNPPNKIADVIGGNGTVWLYKSADVDSDVNAANYISNAEDLGMAVGDIVFVIDTATPKGSLHYVSAISAAGAATLAFGAVA